ncbi:MAG: DMT family transporter [Myxococcales bacterium]|nr:DMT family transporter [Myxococcales bacterium]
MVLLLTLVVLWGTAFMFIRIAVGEIGPLGLTAGRLAVAALVLNGWLWLSGGRYPRDLARWSRFLLLAIVGSALPFTAISWGQQLVSSGTAGLLMGVIPLLTLVLAHFYAPGERMRANQLIGFATGFTGIAVLTGPDALAGLGGGSEVVLRQAAILLGALCYAVNAILIRRLPPTPPLVSSAAVISLAAALMLPLGFREAADYVDASRGAIASVVWLGAAGTAVATWVVYRLILRAGATFASLMNYLIPCVALISGAALLGETVESRALFALFLILAGIALSQLDTLADAWRG